MIGKVVVDLRETRHIGVIGKKGSGKTNYAYDIVEKVLEKHEDINVYVFGVRDKVWEDLESAGLICLYSMEETIKGELLDLEYVNTEENTLIVVDDIGYTIQLLPKEKREEVISNLEELLKNNNVYSILTSFRPIRTYYPKELFNLVDLRIAMELDHESDYHLIYGNNSYKDHNKLPENKGESFAGLKDATKVRWNGDTDNIEVL